VSDDVSVKFGADTKGAEEGAKRTERALEELRGRVEGMSETFKRLGEIIGIAFTVDAVKEFIARMAELGDKLDDTSAILGVSIERVSELKYMAEVSGGTLESMSSAMERLASNMERAGAGSKSERDAFQRMGISFVDAAGHAKSLDQMLNEVADSFSRHADGVEKTALAIQLFGRAGAQMIPILNEGRGKLAELTTAARAAGAVLTTEMVKGMADTHVKLVTLGATVEGFAARLFTLLKPAIDKVITSITDLLASVDLPTLKGWVQGLADFILQIMWSIGSLIIWITARLQILTSSFDRFLEKAAIFAGGAVVGGATMGPLGALVGGAGALIGANLATGITDGVDDGIAIAERNANQRLGAFISNLQSTIATLLNQGALGGSGKGGAAGGAKPGYAGALDQTKLEEIKKALGEVQKTFEGVFSSIISSFDSAISGLITGTMTWKQAFMSVLGSLWQQFVQVLEQMLAKWLATEAMKTVATITGVDARTTAEVAGQGVAGASMIANAIKTIFIDAQKTFAGVFGFLSGLMGPFAAGPAAAAAAAVASVAGALPSFAVGAWELPSDMVARVHKGEMIVPAEQAEQMRQGGGMSGGDIDRLVAKLVPHLKAVANASRATQRNIDNRLRTLRGAT
jgi:hypothetical protein